MNYCKLIFRIGIYLVVHSLLVYPVLAENNLGNINNNIAVYCKEKWTERGELNIRLHNNCVKEEKEGAEILISIRNKYKIYDWYESTEKRWINFWTKRGKLQFSMVANSMKKQVDAYLDANYYRKKGLNKLADRCIAKYSKKDPIDWIMVTGCIEENTDIR